MILRTIIGSLCAAALALSVAVHTSVAAPLKIDIPVNAIAYDAWPVWTAIDEHLFARYGIDASTPGEMQSPSIVASVLSGETLFAVVGEDAVIAADLNGGDIVILTADTEKLLLAVYAGPKLHAIADLKGGKLAISQFGTTTDFVGRYVLQQARLQPETDVVLLPVGSLPNRVAALQSGGADAAIIGPPITFKAQALGFHPIAEMPHYPLLFYSSALIAKRSWVDAHRADTLNVIRGYIAGGASIVTNKAGAVAALAKYTKTDDKQILEGTYDAFRTVLLKVPVPKLRALQTGLDATKIPAAKSANPASFIDTSFVTELDRDGFIANLYK